MEPPQDNKKADSLTTNEFWDGVSSRRLEDNSHRRRSALRRSIGALLADYTWGMTERLFGEYLPSGGDVSALEVGCAPGSKLLGFHRLSGCSPFGLELSPAGVEETQRAFAKVGLNPEQVYQGDLLNDGDIAQHAERYDVVMSFGLIEHFDDPVPVIGRHVSMIKPGGYLVIQIPKLVGFQLATMSILRREFVASHNLNIMHSRRFRDLFETFDLDVLYCGHAGFAKFYGLFTRREKTMRGFAARICHRLDGLMNAAQRLMFFGRNVTWPWSPSLIFIGRRRDV